MAHVCWNGGSRTFAVDIDVNVRATFGSGAFLVDAAQRVVSLSASGAPVTPLCEGETYTVFSGGSRELAKQAQVLRGKLAAAAAEQLKLRERLRKFEECVTAELQQLHTLSRQLPRGGSSSGGGGSGGDGSGDGGGGDAMTSALAQGEPPPLLFLPAAPRVQGGGGAAAPPLTLPDLRENRLGAPRAAGGSGGELGVWSGRPIGTLRTCFVEKNGTPRQGCVVPSSAAELTLSLQGGLNAAHALEGLSAFSHVWLIFIFHKNGNVATKSKVQPPRLDGAKVGLFATRTPHRPNNVGLSLVRLRAIEGGTLKLSGVDLIDGTPILDVKPCVPFADTAPPDATMAPWLGAMPTPDLTVTFSDEAERQLVSLAPSLVMFSGADQARAAISEVLIADPRSVHWRQHRGSLEYGFSIDSLNVVCEFEGNTATVAQVQHIDLCDRSHVPPPKPQPAAPEQAAADPPTLE